MKNDKKYKIQKLDNRYILLKRKPRWNILGFVLLSIFTLGIINFIEWVMNQEGFTAGIMDFKEWTWEYIGSFENSELAVAAKLKDEDLGRSQIIEEYYL